MTRLALVIYFATFTLGAALAGDGVVCGRGGCKTIALKPGCEIVHLRAGVDRVRCRPGK
jgi:hypothetical protein